MAASNQTLIDGSKNVVTKHVSIWETADESAVVKVDVSALQGAPTRVKINKIHYNVNGLIVRLLWDATTDVPIVELQGDGCIDATSFGGLYNNAGAGITGDISLTTVGGASGDSYSIILEMEKTYS